MLTLDTLKHHPVNREIYNLSSIDELVESIKKVGLLQPLTIDQYNQVVSGNRRFEAVKRLGWKKVEVNRISVKNGDDVLLLIHFNKQRIKSIKEILGEYDHLREYYKKNKSSKGSVRSVREKVGNDIQVSDGNLARILFIRNHHHDMVELIDKGILTVNQAYLQSQRSQKEEQSFSFKKGSIEDVDNGNDFRFYQKSSDDMNELKDGEVQTIFTSPPFWNKRLYSEEGGLGNEKTPDEYVQNLVEHLTDCYRVLNKRGSFFLNMGDTFKDGNLQNIPHKVVIQLQGRGWILRNTIIIRHSNPKPSSSKSNLTTSYEFLFVLTKSMDYDYIPTLTPLSDQTKPSLPPRHRSVKDGTINKVNPYIPNPKGKNIGDYWSEDVVTTAVANQKSNNEVEHPAMFTEQIVYLPLLQTSVYPFRNNPQMSPVILDLFCGSLTVNKVVQKINQEYGTNLRFVGYDIKRYF